MMNCATMYHKLSVLLSAGVPVLQSLYNAAKSSRGKIKKALSAVVGPAPGFVLKQYSLTQYYLRAVVILGLLYVPTIIILAILHLTPKTGLPRLFLDAVTLRIPLLGQAIKNLALSRFCRAFALQVWILDVLTTADG